MASAAGRSRLPLPSYGVQVVLGLVLGAALGLLARDIGGPNPLATALETVGALFVQLLKTIVAPLVFTAIVASIAALRGLDDAARLAGRTLGWFALTSLIAVSIGIALGLAFEPGLRSGVAASAATAPATVGSWLDFLKGIVPANALGLSASTKLVDGAATTTLGFNVLQLIVVAAAVGFAAVRVGARGEPFLAFNASLLAITRQVLGWLLRLVPLGTAGLIGDAVARYGWEALSALGWFAGAVYAGLALVLFVVYPLLLVANGIAPGRFFRAAWPALQLAFVTRSSIGTLPVTQEAAERAGVPPAYAAFAVPLGATAKMDGCAAIYPAVAALFVAQYYGIGLGPSDLLLIVVVSVLGSAATAGLTGALVMLTLTLSTLGLPLEGAGLLLAIDPILDMGRTAVNVAGQALVPTIVAKRAGLLQPADGEPAMARFELAGGARQVPAE